MSSVTAGGRLRFLGVAILLVILVTTGSYIRTRTVDESETADWLVILQLGLCIVGGAVGLLLIRQHSVGGNGARLLIAYCAAVIVSAAFSPYFKLAAGYWMLLAGASLLCIGLVASVPTEASLRRLEYAMFCTMGLMLVKDSILDWFFLEPPEGEVYRLGESTTSANAMGMMAAMAFCMSFMTTAETGAGKWRGYAWKALLIVVVLLTRSRVALMGVILGMAVRWWFHQRSSPASRSHLLAAGIPVWAGSLVVLAAISWTMGLQPVTAMVDFVNRSEDAATLTTVTGRTEIWGYAVERIFDDAYSILIGHGYGVSKFVLNESNWTASFFAFHSHNTFLEVLLSTGLLGALPFLLWIGYSLKWFTGFARLRESFSFSFALRALSVIAVIAVSTLTESDLASKIGPVTIVFMFYVLALDRQKTFNESYES